MTILAPVQSEIIKTLAQFEAVVENIVELKRSRAEIIATLDREIAAVREKYQKLIAEMDGHLRTETEWAQTWFSQHPEVMDEKRSLRLPCATVGFVPTDRTVARASRRWTWGKIAKALADLPWGKDYLRQPDPEVDKAKILANLATLSVTDLRQAGLKIIDGERFCIEPKAEGSLS